MDETKNCTLQLTLLSEDEKPIPLTVQFEIKGDEVIGLHGVPEEGEQEYEVSFIVRRKGHYYGCYICAGPHVPCPPNALRWVSPCPWPED